MDSTDNDIPILVAIDGQPGTDPSHPCPVLTARPNDSE